MKKESKKLYIKIVFPLRKYSESLLSWLKETVLSAYCLRPFISDIQRQSLINVNTGEGRKLGIKTFSFLDNFHEWINLFSGWIFSFMIKFTILHIKTFFSFPWYFQFWPFLSVIGLECCNLAWNIPSVKC